jgi:Type III restriction enzyme, res subunit
MVPTFLSGDLRIALPSAWTMSMVERRGSMKPTPSMLGTSTPSPRQRALLSSPRSFGARSRKRSSRRSRCPLVIVPETWWLHSAPAGRARGGIQAITSGISALNSRAALTRPWKGDDAQQLVLAHALGEPYLPGQSAGVGDLLTVPSDQLAAFGVGAVGFVVHPDDHDLVVGEQVALDPLPEAEAVQDGAEDGLVIHRGDLDVEHSSLAAQARGDGEGIRGHRPGQMLMACGTGKTLAAMWIAERLESRRTLILVPSLSLLAQTLPAPIWSLEADANGPLRERVELRGR